MSRNFYSMFLSLTQMLTYKVVVATLKDHVTLPYLNKMQCKKHFLIICLRINMFNSLRPSGHDFWSFWFCSQ